jgi:hypothetical protein
MKITKRSSQPHAGHWGVAFETDANPDTPGEGLLQQVQFELAGTPDPRPNEPDAHLFRIATREKDLITGEEREGPTFIGLWVRGDQEGQAASLLSARGFTFASA